MTNHTEFASSIDRGEGEVQAGEGKKVGVPAHASRCQDDGTYHCPCVRVILGAKYIGLS